MAGELAWCSSPLLLRWDHCTLAAAHHFHWSRDEINLLPLDSDDEPFAGLLQ
jgi:hypothetical protein